MTTREQLVAAADTAHSKLSRGRRDVRRFWVPGRIEVLGKHTDYAGGRSLLCAVERGFCITASPRADIAVNVVSADTGEPVTSTYVDTVVSRLRRDFAPLIGADIAFASNLPIAAGVSSSSALVTALFLAIAGVNDLESRAEFRSEFPNADALAGYLGAVENGLPFGSLAGARGVGTFGGSEDHTAILRARAGALVQYRFCPVQFEQAVALPDDYSFIIASSGVRAEKAGAALGAYNRLSTLSRQALERWNVLTGRSDPTLGKAAAHAGDELVRVLERDAAELAERAAHFLIESEEIIPASADALARHDLDAFGARVDRSMNNATRMLHNQVPETIYLARRARELGATAASAFGAGFGGSVWALVPENRAPEICERLRADYAAAFPRHASAAEFFATAAGEPARRL